jgi:hypothetical protein
MICLFKVKSKFHCIVSFQQISLYSRIMCKRCLYGCSILLHFYPKKSRYILLYFYPKKKQDVYYCTFTPKKKDIYYCTFTPQKKIYIIVLLLKKKKKRYILWHNTHSRGNSTVPI